MFGIDFSKKVALQFSGGKDSLACLYLLKPHWDKITVFWVDSGDAFAETHEQIKGIAALIPNFVAVQGKRKPLKDAKIYPVDFMDCQEEAENLGLLPKNVRDFSRLPFYKCCAYSLWEPMAEAVKGFDYVIRGQRSAEQYKSTLRSGDTCLGIRYVFPIEGWTDAQVIQFLQNEGVEIPRQYLEHENATSLDCMSCTAYLTENKWKQGYMKKHYPKEFSQIEPILSKLGALQ